MMYEVEKRSIKHAVTKEHRGFDIFVNDKYIGTEFVKTAEECDVRVEKYLISFT